MNAILQSLMDSFRDVLDVSITSGIVILFVILVRLFLKKAPKIFSYALWGIVLLRLLVPVSIESPVSVVPQQSAFSAAVSVDQMLPEMEFETPADHAYNIWQAENTLPAEPAVQVSGAVDPITYLTIGWLLGMLLMLLHSIVSYGKLRKKVRIALPLQKNIFIADDIHTPFVMGIFHPTIFLPGSLEETERRYIVAHERHHIRRGDHIFKALGFLALTIHWFNPLVWLAFVLAGRDMEMSCDEAVIRKLGAHIRADYSASLLNLATGHRLFSITPLAFGEGDPTGRVRNLANWKKPAVWVIVICIVLCAVLAVCLLTDREVPAEPEISAAETEPAATQAPETKPLDTETPETDNWNIAIKPDDVSRTGATALFVYGGTTEFSYGDFLSLQQWTGETWVPVKELDGYEYYVGDSSYPVLDGYGMVHEWSDRFGALPDGHYRLGKIVTHDETGEERFLYCEFSIPDSIRIGPLPLEELPERYPAEEAMLDDCFVQRDGMANDNKALFKGFAFAAKNGNPSFIRIVNWYYGDNSYCTTHDLTFDGSRYTLCWIENGKRQEKQFTYLKHFEGEAEQENADYDTYEHYILTNDSTVVWSDDRGVLINTQTNAPAEHVAVYSDYTKAPVLLQLPIDLTRAVLEFEGEPLITVTNPGQLEKIHQLFHGADVLGYEPKTHSTGLQLHLVLTFGTGVTMTIDLDPDRDICKVGDHFVFYGAADEPDYIEKLWDYLGISAWPDTVYEKYPNAYRN